MYPPGQYGSGMDWMRSIPTEEVVLGSSPFLLNHGPGTGTSPFNTKPGTRLRDQVEGPVTFILNQGPGTRTSPFILNQEPGTGISPFILNQLTDTWTSPFILNQGWDQVQESVP